MQTKPIHSDWCWPIKEIQKSWLRCLPYTLPAPLCDFLWLPDRSKMTCGGQPLAPQRPTHILHGCFPRVRIHEKVVDAERYLVLSSHAVEVFSYFWQKRHIPFISAPMPMVVPLYHLVFSHVILRDNGFDAQSLLTFTLPVQGKDIRHLLSSCLPTVTFTS